MDQPNPICTTLIGLTGAAGSGKSTAAEYLSRHFGFQVIKFAGPLKAGLSAMLRYSGMSEKEIATVIEGQNKEVPLDVLGGRTPRHAMQTLGTEWGRTCMGGNFWVEMARSAVLRLPRGSRILMDDVRFENEADMIRSLGGRIIMITGRGGITGDHVSEKGVGAPDLVIRNDSTIPEFQRRLIAAVR